MKFKQSIKTFTLLLAALSTSVSNIWAQEPSGQTVYLAAFKAQSAGESSGSGTVKLTWVDAQGQLFDNTAVSFLNTAMPYATGNPSNGDAFASTAMVIGATLTATESIENSDPESTVNMALRNMMFNAGADSSHLFMTPFAYFKADAQGDAGSYFAGWTFNDARIWQQDTAMDKSAPASAYFKVLPQPANVFYMAPPSSVPGLEAAYAGAVSSPNNIYAVFNKYLLSNPTATSAQLEAVGGATTTLDVSIDVEGDPSQFKENYADFVFPSMPGTVFYEDTYGSWSWNLAREPYAVGPTTMRAEVTVTYTAKADITPGAHTTSITVSMEGVNPSSLTIPLSVNALDPDRPAAYWFDGKTEQTSGSLAEMLATDISSYTNPILKLNKPVGIDLTFSGKNFTLDLNGNTSQAIIISSGNVTIAYSKYGGSATSLTVNGGKAILCGGTFGALTITNGIVEQNGATVAGAVTNAGTLTTMAGTFNGGLISSNGTLTLNGGTFNGTNAVQVTGGIANINRGTLNGTTVGLLVSGGTATIKKLAAITSDGSYSAKRTAGTLNVECGKFGKPLNGTINFTSGFFMNQNYGISTEGYTEMLISTGVEYNEGYRYFLGTDESALANGVGVCRIGSVSYSTLEDALAYANNNPNEELVIFMTNDYILPAGYYTLPAKATLVVPMSDEQAKEVNKTAPRLVYNDVQNAPENSYANNPLVEYRRLTFASGVNMDVFGAIEMTGTQYSTNEAYTSQPVGPYGHLVMEEGSHITLQSGAEIRAWGFMTGKGETDARRGAIVREMFQMGDWKGAMTSVKITGMVPSDFPLQIGDDSDKKIFPVTQYFIQNVESPVKYHPGALLSTSAAVSEGIQILGSVSMTATDIAVVGVSGVHTAIFLMDNEADAENTWVRKWYDAVNDVQVYDVNSGAHIGSMELDLGTISLMGYTLPVRLNSAKFDLPLTSNFKIHLLSGSMDFKQNTCLLPGAEVEVDKESVVSVTRDISDPEHTGALYVYDAAEWDKYAYCNEYNGSTLVKGTAYTKVVRYAPSWNGRPTVRNEQVCPLSAAINVHGRFETGSGFVYTSQSGANIFSSNEDAGTFLFDASAESAGTPTVWQVQGVGTYKDKTFYPAKLKNGVLDPAFANTATAHEGDAYCYTDNKWNIMKVDDEDPCFMIDDYHVSYAKPAEYVALANGKTCNADHTYSDAAGAGRLFILTDNCQWWEVEKKDNLYHCIHPNNDTYYYWDDSDPSPDEHHWAEKTFTITWKNWDGTPVYTADAEEDPTDKYIVTYGTMAEFLGTNPTREANIDYTYDFTGWSPELAPVTSNVTYTATYEQKERKYTIIFLQEGGVEIERQFLTHNAVPVCENMPTKIGHTLVWTPAIAAVTGDATYTATWEEEPPTSYEVTFYDYDGTTPLQQSDVNVGDMPIFSAATPTGKPATSEFTYVFDHWSPDIEEVSATSIKSYTAIYREVAKTYTVIFQNEDGTEIERHEYTYGATPVCSATPTKPNTAQYSYSFAWTPQIETVRAAATYRATFTPTLNKYTVTLKSNPSEACTFTGAGIYKYNDDVAISQTPKDGYTFTKWTDENGNDVATLPTKVTADINLVANFTFEGTGYTITWKNYDGSLLATVNQKEGTATVYTGATPTKPADAQYTYTFDGWNAGSTSGTYYKNNMTPKATADATYYAHFAATTIPDLNVTGVTTLTEPVTYQNLVITSNGISSGQLINPNFLTITGNAHFDLALNAQAETWYAFGLPWKVKTNGGMKADGANLSIGNNCYILEYDGAARASQTTDAETSSYWKYVSAGATLEAGKLYMIYLRYAAATLRFTKAAGEPIINNSITLYANASGNDSDKGWNGVANSTLAYATFASGGYGLKYVPGVPTSEGTNTDRYDVFNLATEELIVGQPFFVQVNAGGTLVANGANVFSAPRREMNRTSEYEVRIAPKNADYTDRIYVIASEEKEDQYVIGQDLGKISIANGIPQMWINRYDTKLSVNTQAMINNQATFPLGINIPADGTYTIRTVTEPIENEELFVTINGAPVWNLSTGQYTLNLAAGNTNEYGLLVVYHPAPEISTGCDQLQVTDKPSVRKVLINGQVFIVRDGAVYTIFGQKVK